MTTVFHLQTYGSFTKIQSYLRRKKLHETNQGSNFLGSIFSNRDNVRTSIQFRRKSTPCIFEDDFSSMTGPIHFHINSTNVIRPVKQNQLIFSSRQVTSCLTPQYLVDQIQVQKSIVVAATDQMPVHT